MRSGLVLQAQSCLGPVPRPRSSSTTSFPSPICMCSSIPCVLLYRAQNYEVDVASIQIQADQSTVVCCREIDSFSTDRTSGY
jgi:hypothetical protein